LATDVEKFRALFVWIADNISYDYPMYQKIIRKEKKLKSRRKKLNAFSMRTSKAIHRKMILHKKSICSGYATLLEYMCQEAGLLCVFVSGYGRTWGAPDIRGANHAWNAVKMNKEWYLCDVTWASGSVDEIGKFHKHFDDLYFLTDPDLFIANHYPTDPTWALLKDPPPLNQFLNTPFKADGFLRNKINQYTPDKQYLNVKTDAPLEFRFTSNASEVDSLATLLVVGTSRKKYDKVFVSPLVQAKTGEYVLTHTFDVRGSYRVYIFINHRITFVYRVRVA
jgi:transglutaminase/protease-like cytokinesis protein 3